MNGLLRWCTKVCLSAVAWVFILSIRYEGQPLFYRANDLLVQNSMVRTIDDGLVDAWHRLTKAAKVAFAKSTPDDAKAG